MDPSNWNPFEVHEYFQSLGLDIWDAWTFFKLLDADGGGEANLGPGKVVG